MTSTNNDDWDNSDGDWEEYDSSDLYAQPTVNNWMDSRIESDEWALMSQTQHGWQCTKCTYINKNHSSNKCTMCQFPKKLTKKSADEYMQRRVVEMSRNNSSMNKKNDNDQYKDKYGVRAPDAIKSECLVDSSNAALNGITMPSQPNIHTDDYIRYQRMLQLQPIIEQNKRKQREKVNKRKSNRMLSSTKIALCKSAKVYPINEITTPVIQEKKKIIQSLKSPVNDYQRSPAEYIADVLGETPNIDSETDPDTSDIEIDVNDDKPNDADIIENNKFLTNLHNERISRAKMMKN